MNPQFSCIFEPFTFPSGVTVANRIIMAPMTTNSSFVNGMITKDELDYYAERAGEVGAVITACAYISKEGKAFEGGMSVADDSMIPSLSKLAQTIKEKGAKAILQIFHGGRMVSSKVNGGIQPVSASAVPALRPDSETPRELTSEEVGNIIKRFGDATRRAIDAGFDGVELHGANTYLLQQFVSPHSNRRNDKWGGSLQKRLTFPLEVVKIVKETVESYAKTPFIIGYRLSPEEAEEPGITIEDTLVLANQLTEQGLDYIHVSLGDAWRGSIRDQNDTKPIINRLKEHLNGRIPLISVGSVQSPKDAVKLLENDIPLVSLGRELLVDPQWLSKVKNGEEDKIYYDMSIDNQEKLVIPASMWSYILSIPNWLPVREYERKDKSNEPWIKV